MRSRFNFRLDHKELWIHLALVCLVNITGKVNGEGDVRSDTICWQQVISGRGWHCHCGGDADVRLQRPIFSVLLSPNDPIFLLIVSAVTQRPHILCVLFDVLHSAATGSYCLFQFHRQIDHFCHFRRFFFKFLLLTPMQPSMANLNSPSSRVVKDSTPFRRRILRCKSFGKGESWPSLFLDVVNLDLIKFRHRWILNERTFYSFIILFIWKWILT